ncbi:RICIN domain-containing protein, partial [Patescibacteria group bacterium]
MTHTYKEANGIKSKVKFFKISRKSLLMINRRIAMLTTVIAFPILLASAYVFMTAIGFVGVLAGDSDHIRVKDTAFCLNTPYRKDDGNVFVWTCDGGDSDQDWEWYGELLRLKGTGYCLNTPHRYNEGNVFLWSCNSGDADQKWQRDGELIKLKDTNYCLNNPSAYRYDGGNVNIYTCNSGDADQKWVFGGSGGACPSGGWYCGGSVGENPDNLYYCTGAGAIPTLSQECENGCQVNDPGYPDECILGACPTGGWYCGGSVGENPDNLYYCTGAG